MKNEFTDEDRAFAAEFADELTLFIRRNAEEKKISLWNAAKQVTTSLAVLRFNEEGVRTPGISKWWTTVTLWFASLTYEEKPDRREP